MQHAINMNIEQVCLPSFTAEAVTEENPAGRRNTTTSFLVMTPESLNCFFSGCNPDGQHIFPIGRNSCQTGCHGTV